MTKMHPADLPCWFVLLVTKELSGIRRNLSYLSGGFGPLPDAEVAYEPGQEQTECQLPSQAPNVLDSAGDAEHAAPVGGEIVQVLLTDRAWVLLLREKGVSQEAFKTQGAH